MFQKPLFAFFALIVASSISGNTFAQPAAPLTSVQISGVGSTNYLNSGLNNPARFYQSIAPTQLNTNFNHGGAQMRVVTEEYGYGGNRVATIAGFVLPSSANYQSLPICKNSSGQYTTSCSPGQTVYGYQRYWNLDGYQAGVFSYQSTSLNTPIQVRSDSITIQ